MSWNCDNDACMLTSIMCINYAPSSVWYNVHESWIMNHDIIVCIQVHAMQVFAKVPQWMNSDKVTSYHAFKIVLYFTIYAIESWGCLMPDNLAIT